jgi:hypothetical protein
MGIIDSLKTKVVSLVGEEEKIKSVRRKHDQYLTPSWATEILLRKFPGINGRILEPCAGKGHMADVLKSISGSTVVTNDIDLKMKSMFHHDAKQNLIYEKADASWIISNPPYSQALEIVAKSYEHCKKGCAFLLRLSFLEPTADRGPWLKAHLPKFICVLPRISFTEDGRCDSVTSVWVVWHKLQVDTMPPFDFVPRSEITKKETA